MGEPGWAAMRSDIGPMAFRGRAHAILSALTVAVSTDARTENPTRHPRLNERAWP